MNRTPSFPVSPFRRLSNEMKLRSRKSRRSFANDFSVLNPTIWAQEAVLQLLPNMVYGNLVTRDFDNKVARFGDVVNAYVPSTFVMNKKGSTCEAVSVQDASGSAIQVPMDQWPGVSFLICDGEEDRSQLDLVDSLLTPAVLAIGQGIDRIIASQVYRFINNASGHALLGTSANIQQYVLEAREKMNRLNVPLGGRILALTPGTETTALQVEAFTEAQSVGDGGQAQREAALGRKYGFDIYMTQQQAEVLGGGATIGTSGSVLVNGAATAGATIVNVDGAGAGSSAVNVLVGQWLIIAGDDLPHQVTANATGALTISPALTRAVADNAVVTILQGGLVNNASGYVGTSTSPRVIGWNKAIATDTWIAGSPPQVGQMITFGSDVTNRYVIQTVAVVSSTAYNITLDRPLVSAIVDNAIIQLGPAARYNFAFSPQALALVSRPLPQPRAGTGAIARVISDPISKVSLRVTITYDGSRQGHLVTVDTLMGVGILQSAMGVPMLA